MGDLIAWNERDSKRIAETVRAHETGPSSGPKRKRELRDRDFTRVKFRNNSGETVPAYGCMRVTSIETDEGVQRFVIAKPDTSFNRLYLVNSGSDVASGAPGWGTWLWHADWVLYDDASTPAFGESWGPQNASWEIKKWRYGFTIWGSPTGGTTDLVMASQDWVNQFYGQTDAAINKGSSGTVSVFDGANADTAINVASVENKYANVLITKKVTCAWQAGVWRLIAAECG